MDSLEVSVQLSYKCSIYLMTGELCNKAIAIFGLATIVDCRLKLAENMTMIHSSVRTACAERVRI